MPQPGKSTVSVVSVGVTGTSTPAPAPRFRAEAAGEFRVPPTQPGLGLTHMGTQEGRETDCPEIQSPGGG